MFAGGQAWADCSGIVLKGGDVRATDLLDASLASLFACSGGGSQSRCYSRIVRCPVFTKSSSCYSAWCILPTCLCVSNDIACKSNPDVLISRSHCAALFNCCYLFCLHLPRQPAGGNTLRFRVHFYVLGVSLRFQVCAVLLKTHPAAV